jgi:hypothetical protein
MITFSPAELLTAWERCLPLSPVGRAVALLELAEPGLAADAITALSVGSRDRELLRLRVSAFGTAISGLVTCPECGQTVELTADANDIIAAAGRPTPGRDDELALDRNGYHVRFRLPTSADLLALAVAWPAAPPGADAERFLLGRCLRWAEHDGSPVAPSELPDEIVELVGSSMNEHDPLADIELACDCPDCGEAWVAPLDVPGFLWAELTDFATRLLRDVHVLASGYGWCEAEILALTPVRRQAYLDLVAG